MEKKTQEWMKQCYLARQKTIEKDDRLWQRILARLLLCWKHASEQGEQEEGE